MNNTHIRGELDQLRLRVDVILQAVRLLGDDIARLQDEFDDVPETLGKKAA